MPSKIFSHRAASIACTLALFFSSLIFVRASLAQELIDRIAARVENDIILLSDVRHLGRYQMLVDGKSETEQQVRDKIATQTHLTNYLDSRFRPSVQVDATAIEDFYNSAVLPRAKARGQEPPSLEASRDVIQEALIEQSIDAQAEQWLKESRSRIHVERLLDEEKE